MDRDNWRWDKPVNWATFCRALLQSGLVTRKSECLKLWQDSVRTKRAIRVRRGIHRLRRLPNF